MATVCCLLSVFLSLFVGFGVAGGAIFCFGDDIDTRDNMKILNLAFLGNVARFDGGALFAVADCDIFEARWLTFESNAASRLGGAVYLSLDTNVLFESAAFINNSVCFLPV